jgi:putative oxidoreductase
MTDAARAIRASAGFCATLGRIRRALDAVGYRWLALPLRFAVATVFWNSAMSKLANWETTLSLFADEYQLPLIPPEMAAYLATSIEISTPVLLLLGLLTRPVALLLLGMTGVIEIFVYPLAWPTHIQWAAMLLVLLCRGPGAFSLDHLILRFCLREREG